MHLPEYRPLKLLYRHLRRTYLIFANHPSANKTAPTVKCPDELISGFCQTTATGIEIEIGIGIGIGIGRVVRSSWTVRECYLYSWFDQSGSTFDLVNQGGGACNRKADLYCASQAFHIFCLGCLCQTDIQAAHPSIAQNLGNRYYNDARIFLPWLGW